MISSLLTAAVGVGAESGAGVEPGGDGAGGSVKPDCPGPQFTPV